MAIDESGGLIQERALRLQKSFEKGEIPRAEYATELLILRVFNRWVNEYPNDGYPPQKHGRTKP